MLQIILIIITIFGFTGGISHKEDNKQKSTKRYICKDNIVYRNIKTDNSTKTTIVYYSGTNIPRRCD